MTDVFDEDDQKPFRLWPSEAYHADLHMFRSNECPHTNFELRESTDAGGAKHLKKQCLECGESIGNSVSRKEFGDKLLLPFESTISDKYKSLRERQLKSIQQKHIRLQKRDSGEHSRKYVEHINSVKWRGEIRPKILKRANGLCDGCLVQPATDVHHITYEHLGDEFMFELLAVCKICHDRLHPEKFTSEDIAAEINRLECQCRFGDDPGLNPKCLKFGISVKEAIAELGPCGPDRNEHEGLK